MSSQSPLDQLPSAELVAATQLPTQVKQTRQALVALLREVDPQAADWVEEIRAARGPVPGVVVLGETKRGKSALVNALLDTPDLSPVDAAAGTATYLWFRHGPEWAGHACCPPREPVGFPVEELRRRATDDGEPAEGEPPPRYLDVTAPLGLLEDVELVDTPGVGGLDSAHGELAAEAAASASALLFVVDASAPLGRAELDFLRRVSDRVETVVFALTKTDRHPGWRRVLETDRELLATHAPRFATAPFHPVSARLAELAARAPDADTAELLRRRCGVGELREELRTRLANRAAMLAEANALRGLSTVLDEQVSTLDAERRGLTRAEHEIESLRGRREELTAERRSSTRGWQVRLRTRIQRARVEANHEVADRVREVHNRFRREIDSADRARLERLPGEVDAALRLVSGRVSTLLSRRLDEVARACLAELFTPEELGVVRSQFARGPRAPVAPRPPDRRPATAEDKLLVFMGVSGGLGVGRAAALPLAGLGVGVLNPVVLPLTLALGLGAGWWMARTRRHAADKQHLKQWLTEAVAESRSALEQAVSEQLIEAEQQLSLALDDALHRRVEAIESELREVDRALKLDSAERDRRLSTVDRRLEELTTGREKVTTLLERIRELRDRPA
ncbi:dynamin family protein [Actinopolyspora mortivallis]|uniref:Dynamin n=1 Tax=Actinopolyspora mortivallis TaxID=33906 RepID=A0A2T0GRF5_ACTMO|nr:dynamin family protein [Actinopolyspora mortivallis]PRW61684.1 dynamin [Actinopolyspora mortivallis]